MLVFTSRVLRPTPGTCAIIKECERERERDFHRTSNNFIANYYQMPSIVVLHIANTSSLNFISGSIGDFIKELFGESFVIINPKATSSCGCGLSFSI